jgi:periplasmic divalent cation tolerance protein
MKKKYTAAVNKYLTIFVTVPDKKTSQKIIKSILNKKLAACVSVIGGVSSFYWWKNSIEKSLEFLLIMKTVKSKFKKLEKDIKAIHPYEVPEIVAVDICAANKDYLKWIKEYAR